MIFSSNVYISSEACNKTHFLTNYGVCQGARVQLHAIPTMACLLAACNTLDLKHHGFKLILDPFIKEVKQLESDCDVQFQWNDRQTVVHGTLVSFSADSLAAHDLLGFLSPSANMLCRLCKATRESV